MRATEERHMSAADKFRTLLFIIFLAMVFGICGFGWLPV
jgi:hypothetical protein